MSNGGIDPVAGVVVIAGKGGVGSSTVAAAYATAVARSGASVLFVSVDGRSDVGPLLGGPKLDDRDRELRRLSSGGVVRGRTIPADQAFGDYLELRGVGGMLRRAASAASLPMIAAATPGLEHLLVLGKIKELERDGAADLIVVDAPPAGHAASFLRSASGLSEVISSGPVREQAGEVTEMLTDPARCRAIVVALAEITPTTEAIELHHEIADPVADGGLAIAAERAIVNGCWPVRPGLSMTPAGAARREGIKLDAATRDALAVADEFGRERLALQESQIERLTDAIGAPIRLPRLPVTELSTADVDVLADAVVEQWAEPAVAGR